MTENLIPQIGVVTQIRRETDDVKTFRVQTPSLQKHFEHMPGQCAMLSLPRSGEAMFSITSSPSERDYLEFSIKKCGRLTESLHSLEEGQQLLIRGPYGNHFPVEGALKCRNLLFIAGGIGIAPLRSVINYCRAFRDDYGKIDIVYGARSPKELVGYREICEQWQRDSSLSVHLTVDAQAPSWTGHVGFVPNFVKELGFTPDCAALVCGPPVMIRFTLEALTLLGFEKSDVYTTMELRMKCGVGKCGRCNIGSKYVCKDGPVFSFDELDALPDEY